MTTYVRRHAGFALIALLVPVMLLPVGLLSVLAGLGALVSGFVALASWVRQDTLHTRESRRPARSDRAGRRAWSISDGAS